MPPLRVLREADTVFPVSAGRGPKLSEETLEVLEAGMRMAVTDRHGTLHAAMHDVPWEFYGKTGTAEVPGESHSWVMGYLRAPRPLALAVVVEHAGSGGGAAAGVARQVLLRYLGEG